MIATTGSTTDTEIAAEFVAVAGIAWAAVKKYGPIIQKVLSKLLVSSTVVDHVKTQGTETALAKLQTPDDVFCVLDSFELNPEGRIVLKNHGRVNTLLKLKRELTDAEKDEVIKAVKSVLMCEDEEK